MRLNHNQKNSYWVAGICLLCGVILFHFFGNAVRSYIDTTSMFYWWGSQWFNDLSDTDHGPIILLLAGWIFWRNIKDSSKESNRPRPWLGVALVLLALGTHFVGYLVQQTRISILGFLIFIVGTSYLAGGDRWGRASVFPAFFMLFSVPLEFLWDNIGFPLRLAVISMTHWLAVALGFDVIQTGTQLFSPDGSYQYDVAPACSGIRSLTALTALSLLIGYLNFKSFWRRSLLLILALPYAFLGNVLRIFAIVLAAEWFGQEAGTFVHEWFGFVIFVIVLGLAILTVSATNKFFPEGDDSGDDRKKESSEKTVEIPLLTLPQTLIFCAIVIVGSLILTQITRRLDTMTLRYHCGVALSPNGNDPVTLPKLLDYEWLGKEQEISRVEREALPSDTGFSRMLYTDIEGNDVLLSIVLSGKDRTSIHRPEICLVGQGWSIKNRSVHEFLVPALDKGKLNVTLLRMEYTGQSKNGKQEKIPGLFAYWFVGGDTLVPTHWERMWRMAKDRLFGLKTHRWAYVFAQTVVLDGENAGLERMQEVISLAVPEFQRVGFEDG